MSETHWGSHKSELTSGTKTIMEIWADEQPVMNRLNDYGDVAEWVEHRLTELIANFVIATKKKDETISFISYGRNYIVQPPEFLLSEYQKSKAAGDGVVILDRKLNEYLTSKYKNAPETLRAELIKKELEYNVHYLIKEVKEVFGNVQAQRKMLFVDWWETLDSKDLEKPIGALEADRDKFVNDKIAELGIEDKIPETNSGENKNKEDE